MIKTIIVAVSANQVIGKNNRLLWRLSDDLKHFKEITMGHFVIMGRKTFESIGRILKGRTNIVISRNPSFVASGAIVMESIEKALLFARSEKQQEVFIIGGGEIYAQSLPLADRIIYTKVYADIDGDVLFPDFDMNEWEVRTKTGYKKNNKNDHDFEIIEMVRKHR